MRTLGCNIAVVFWSRYDGGVDTVDPASDEYRVMDPCYGTVSALGQYAYRGTPWCTFTVEAGKASLRAALGIPSGQCSDSTLNGDETDTGTAVRCAVCNAVASLCWLCAHPDVCACLVCALDQTVEGCATRALRGRCALATATATSRHAMSGAPTLALPPAPMAGLTAMRVVSTVAAHALPHAQWCVTLTVSCPTCSSTTTAAGRRWWQPTTVPPPATHATPRHRR